MPTTAGVPTTTKQLASKLKPKLEFKVNINQADQVDERKRRLTSSFRFDTRTTGGMDSAANWGRERRLAAKAWLDWAATALARLRPPPPPGDQFSAAPGWPAEKRRREFGWECN